MSLVHFRGPKNNYGKFDRFGHARDPYAHMDSLAMIGRDRKSLPSTQGNAEMSNWFNKLNLSLIYY